MKPVSMLVAAAAAASLAACNAAGGKEASLAGNWKGTITCYNMEMPFSLTVDAATPTKALLSKGDLATVTWDGTITADKAAVTIKSDGPADGAETIAGTLAGDDLSGTMDKQLCTKFTLTRQH